MLRGAGEFATDVSKQRVSLIFKSLAVQELDGIFDGHAVPKSR